LLDLTRQEVDALLSKIECKVINVIENKHQRAYLLSESSLFVWKDKLILKTCGRTNLLGAVKSIFIIAENFGFLTNSAEIFYSRRKFMNPNDQPSLHQKFRTEVEALQEISNGSAYCFGRLNEECWYLYTTVTDVCHIEQPDQTFEIVMSELDQDCVQLFTKAVCSDGDEVSRRSGINDLFPGLYIDSYLFEPGGFSCNGISDEFYFNIHVTPQETCSYASFETNFTSKDYMVIVQKILQIFQPQYTFFTLFTNQSSCKRHEHDILRKSEILDGAFIRRDLAMAEIKDYTFLYASFQKKSSSNYVRKYSENGQSLTSSFEIP